ncbi:MAG: hypothetical protein JXQ69_08375 [Paludibacteraceae bacterium]|nr:hypothetical protein [Paludibacteraceae bacterium]
MQKDRLAQNKRLIHLLIVTFLIPLTLSAQAVKVDELLTDKNLVQSDVSVSYINTQRSDSNVGLVGYQTVNGDYVVIPTYIGNVASQSDYLGYSLALRYGFNSDIEVFAYGNLYSSSERTLYANSITSHNDKGFSSAGIGGVYQVHNEDGYPALLLGGTLDVIERDATLHKDFYLKSGSIFLASYYTSDPVVFFIKATYGFNSPHKSKTHAISAGDVLSITPQIHFAVNPYTSLNWGISYEYKQKDTYDGEIIAANQSRLSWLFGVSYEIFARSVLSADMEKTDTSTYSQSAMTLNYSYKF